LQVQIDGYEFDNAIEILDRLLEKIN
jgi:hypothetical protein